MRHHGRALDRDSSLSRWLVLLALSLLAIPLVLGIALVGAAAVVGGGPPAGRGACASVAGHPVCYEVGRVPSTVAGEVRSHADRLYGRVVSALAHRRTRVYCWSQADWRTRTAERAARWPEADPLGPWRAFTHWTPRSVHLSPEICTQLARVVAEHGPLRQARSVDALAWSVETLAHESVHAGGIANEAVAECYGLQMTAEVATRLGRSRDEGRYLFQHRPPLSPPKSRGFRRGPLA